MSPVRATMPPPRQRPRPRGHPSRPTARRDPSPPPAPYPPPPPASRQSRFGGLSPTASRRPPRTPMAQLPLPLLPPQRLHGRSGYHPLSLLLLLTRMDDYVILFVILLCGHKCQTISFHAISICYTNHVCMLSATFPYFAFSTQKNFSCTCPLCLARCT